MAVKGNSTYRYAVLGAGRQGTAAAYDMALRGQAQSVVIGDYDLSVAQASAARVNDLLEHHHEGRPIVTAAQVDAGNHQALVEFLRDVDSFLSAVPFVFNLGVTRAAIEARASMCDLGGNTALVCQQLQFIQAEAAVLALSVRPGAGYRYYLDGLCLEFTG
jgi:lysine 6-dehydrogenase